MILKKSKPRKTLYALFVLLIITLSTNTYAWDLEYDEDGIQIYTQDIAGSNFKAFRGTTTVNSDLINVIAHQVNIESMPEWLHDCSKSELISELNGQDMYIYQRTSAPWPVSDRDYVLHMNITQDPQDYSVLITFEASSDFAKTDSECVQVTKLTGYWRFTPTEADKVHIEYKTAADPAGQVPSWLANSFVVDQPLGTLKNLKKRVENKKYVLPETMSFIKTPALNLK
jgi:hypothetical protein